MPMQMISYLMPVTLLVVSTTPMMSAELTRYLDVKRQEMYVHHESTSQSSPASSTPVGPHVTWFDQRCMWHPPANMAKYKYYNIHYCTNNKCMRANALTNMSSYMQVTVIIKVVTSCERTYVPINKEIEYIYI